MRYRPSCAPSWRRKSCYSSPIRQSAESHSPPPGIAFLRIRLVLVRDYPARCVSSLVRGGTVLTFMPEQPSDLCWWITRRWLTAQWNECVQSLFAQVKSTPHQDREVNRKERVGEERIANAHVRGDGTAEITSQQDRAENGRAWNYIEDDANQHDDPERENNALGISELNRCFHDKLRLHQFHDAVHKQEQHGQRAHDATGPKFPFRDGSCLSGRMA